MLAGDDAMVSAGQERSTEGWPGRGRELDGTPLAPYAWTRSAPAWTSVFSASAVSRRPQLVQVSVAVRVETAMRSGSTSHANT